jgi:hypothetical protein
MHKTKIILFLCLILAACGGGGGSVPVSGSGPNAQLAAGDTLTHGGQTFTVVSVSSDGTQMTVSASSNGFVPASTQLSFTLLKGDDGIYRYSTNSLSIEYNPTTNIVSWNVTSGTSETTIVNEVLATNGSPIIPGFSATTNLNQGQPSTTSVATMYATARETVENRVNQWRDEGWNFPTEVNLSYENINVVGLQDVHSAGWTGLGANVAIIDDFSNSYLGTYYSDVEFINWNTVGFAHGVVAWASSFVVAPEATYSRIENRTYFSTATPNAEIDVVNWSFEMADRFNAFTNIQDAHAAARNFTENYYQELGVNNPNAVLVYAAGNSGSLSQFTGGVSSSCEVSGDRRTLASCSAVVGALDSSIYSYLNRTIWVGAYDSSAQELEEYTFSAGTGAMNYFMVADGNSVIDQSQGTSFAAPRVAGVLALTVQKFPNLSPQERTRLVLHTANDIGDPGVDPIFGYGLLNAGAALNPIGQLN